MYPSAECPSYGVFVKTFEEQLIDEGCEFRKAIIIGRGKSKLDKLKKYFLFFLYVFKAIRKDDFDLIYVHYMSHSLLPLLLVQKYIKKPLVINAHGSDVLYTSKIGKLIQKLVTNIIKKANLIVVPSSYFEDIVTKKFDLPKDKIFISPSGGIDTKIFKPLEISRDNNLLTIGYISRIDQGKGWDILLNAVSEILNKNDIEFKVLMIGDGSQKDLLFKKISELNLQDYIEYLGPKPHNELAGYYNQFDIFIFPTMLPESLGLVGLEAISCGVPVIASKIGGLQDYIINGQNGYFFTPGNAEELEDKILLFTNNRENFSNIKESVLKYDSKIVAKNMVSKLNEVTKRQ